ncbi:tryptophan--tRNA ligase [Candidatus Dojkabacteria bacterium]|nr:tryptophan--tRNA ligase [Candidatus Dojkabacteria bacterium]
MKKRILTGDRPTGKLHLGHYVGSLLQRVELQDEYEQFVIVADIQALTDNFDNPKKVQENVFELALDYMAVGIDPTKSTIFIQSQIPAIAELFIYFANFVSIEQLSHNPTIKTELAEKSQTKEAFKDSTPLGFYVYPVHQVADIMCVNADLVPVGEDQVPHVELTRDIVRKFNKMYKTDFFHEPKAKVTNLGRLPGTDGQGKMSKSIGNCIYLSDDSETVKAKVMKMYTDPSRIKATDPGKVEGNPVFIYHDAFNPNKSEVAELKERYTKGTVGDVEVKEKLFNALDEFLTPIRQKRTELEKKPDFVMDVLHEGTKKVRTISNEIVEKTRDIIGLRY